MKFLVAFVLVSLIVTVVALSGNSSREGMKKAKPENGIPITQGDYSTPVHIASDEKFEASVVEENVWVDVLINGSREFRLDPINMPGRQSLNFPDQIQTIQWRITEGQPVDIAHINCWVKKRQ